MKTTTSFRIEIGGAFSAAKLPDGHKIVAVADAAAEALGVKPRDAVAAHLARLDGESYNEAHAAAYDAAEAAVDALCEKHVGFVPRDGYGVFLA